MTRRKSKRELERAVEDLGGSATGPLPDEPRSAAQELFWRLFRRNALTPVKAHEHLSGDTPEGDLCLGIGDTFVWYASPADVPEWLVEDLPVELPDPPVSFDGVNT